MEPQHTRARGQDGEQRAAELLRRAGLEILACNVSLARAEIDLIAREEGEGGEVTVVFVEVRGRADDRRGHPFETIDARKQARVRRAASAWLIRQGLWERVAVRFDAVAVVGERLEWLRDAF
ncbi:YraN family protein [Pseudenhygromyxa sp. WMMC2535]|nr:YraN family protein [Pseudenhygromyxa sp. WMMC2535]